MTCHGHSLYYSNQHCVNMWETTLAASEAPSQKSRVELEKYVILLARAAGLSCFAVLINRQRFTKTANIWGITNNTKGRNSNRVVLLHKPGP